MLAINNPGNIRPSPLYKWQGEVGEAKGFIVFDTMENGIRALATNLLTYQRKYGIYTVRRAIERWAPQEDHNDTQAYIAFVAHVCEVDPDDRLDFSDRDTLYWLVTAIGEQENGHAAFTQAVTDAQIDAGIAAALA